MKSVLLSIRPVWCEKIADGKKTIEVRKTRPKLETPFKCYVYCTRNARDLDKLWVLNEQRRQEYGGLTAVCANLAERPDYHYCGNGKVIGEFVCDYILEDTKGEYAREFEKESGLSIDEQKAYSPNGKLYGWHISDLKIYDELKELSEFHHCGENYHFNPAVTKPPQSWCYVKEMVGENE